MNEDKFWNGFEWGLMALVLGYAFALFVGIAFMLIDKYIW